jgi:T-complex protein 1 subunit theta
LFFLIVDDLSQYAMRKFADALEVVPRTLSENAGFNPTDILASLYAAHQEGNANVGVNIEQAGIKDMTSAGILDLYATKEQAYRLASDTAITILRIDQIIMAKAAGGPKAPQQNGNWDED